MRRLLVVLLAAALAGCGSSSPTGIPEGPAGEEPGTGVTPVHPEGVIELRLDIRSETQSGRPYGVTVDHGGHVLVSLLDEQALVRTHLDAAADFGRIGVGFTPTDVAFRQSGGLAYVTNQHSAELGVVDPSSGAQIATVPVPGDPFRVLVSAGGEQVYVTTNIDRVVRIDAGTRAVAAEVEIGDNLNGLALHPLLPRIYVSGVWSGAVYELDAASLAPLRTFSTGGAPQGLEVAPDGSELYVADEGGGGMFVVDLATGGSTHVPLGNSASFELRMTPDGAQLYVGDIAGSVLIVDRETRTVVDELLLGGRPRRIAFDRNGTRAVIADESGMIHFVR